MPVFDITGFHQNGSIVSKDNPNVVRIVCTTAQGIVLAIWGTPNNNTANIDKVLIKEKSDGFPFQIDCDINKQPPPQDFQQQYGHGYWVRQTNRLQVL